MFVSKIVREIQRWNKGGDYFFTLDRRLEEGVSITSPKAVSKKNISRK
jgi:hypothetical protein